VVVVVGGGAAAERAVSAREKLFKEMMNTKGQFISYMGRLSGWPLGARLGRHLGRLLLIARIILAGPAVGSDWSSNR
jgi:hypothetical protein